MGPALVERSFCNGSTAMQHSVTSALQHSALQWHSLRRCTAAPKSRSASGQGQRSHADGARSQALVITRWYRVWEQKHWWHGRNGTLVGLSSDCEVSPEN